MFSYLFPKGSLGIEITTKYVRFVEITKRNNLFRIENFGRIRIPSDTFSEGVLEKKEYLVSILTKILEESRQKNIHIVLPGELQQFFYLIIPKVDTSTIVSEIIFGLKENVLFHEGRDEIIDWHLLGKEEGAMTVRAVSAPALWFRDFKPVLSVLKKATVRIERANQAAIIASHKPDIPEPFLHIQFGDDFTSLSIVEHGKVVVYQELPLSTHRFLLEVQKKLTQPSLVASGYLSHLGILGADVFDFSQGVIKSLSVPVDHALLEYGRNTGNHVRAITLGGVFGSYKGVADLLSKHLRTPTVPAYPWKTFDPRFDESIFDMKKSETLEYLVALGLAIEGQ